MNTSKIVFVTDTLSSGGAERVVSILANYLVLRYRTEIVCLRKMPVFYYIDKEVSVEYADDYAKGWLGKMKWLRSHINKEDIVIPFMVKVYCVTILALLGKRVNIIASERNDPNTTIQPWKILRKLLLPGVQTLVVQTQQIKEFFPERIRKKIEVIVNPVDMNNCYQGVWNSNSKIVLAVGRTDIQKNYSMLIRSFSELHKHHNDYKLEIWGNRDKSEEGEKLQRLILEMNASGYIGIHDRTDDMANLYGKAYMFVMSSDYEGFSNALVEALCSGLPVISTKVSGAIDVIRNRENGILVDVGDEQGLCNAMTKIIENPDLARKMAEDAKKSRFMFEKEKICEKWDLLISSFRVS